MSLNNQVNPTNFIIEIPDSGLTKQFRYNIQTTSIPGLSIPIIDMPLGNQGIGRSSVAGSSLEFDPLNCKFLLDENLQAWTDIYTWMLAYNNYMSHDNQAYIPGTLPKFITLHVLDNTKTNIVLSIHFYDAWPQILGDVEFDFTTDIDSSVTCNVTFAYSHYAVERNGVILTTRKTITDFVKTKSSSISLHPSTR